MQKAAHLGIKMDPELHDKFMVVADYEGRSIIGQVMYLMNRCVREFEAEQGKITPEDIGAVKKKRQRTKNAE